jgi:hypothetical protein
LLKDKNCINKVQKVVSSIKGAFEKPYLHVRYGIRNTKRCLQTNEKNQVKDAQKAANSSINYKGLLSFVY